jgi:hypothetical protein
MTSKKTHGIYASFQVFHCSVERQSFLAEGGCDSEYLVPDSSRKIVVPKSRDRNIK